MGFFSQDCESCGHPLICDAAAEDRNAWMSRGVAISRHNEIASGEYDGYGNLGGSEYAVGEDATVYHRACWDAEGHPLDYRGPSRHSADQGWFFDDGDHNWATPAEAKAHPNPCQHTIIPRE